MLTVGYVRSLGFEVRHDPLPDNPAHTLVVGENTKAKCSLPAEATVVLITPLRSS